MNNNSYKTIEYLIDGDDNLRRCSLGFPSIGSKKECEKIKKDLPTIIDTWEFYSHEIYNLNKNFSSIINLGTGDPLALKPFGINRKNLNKFLKRKDLYKYQPAAGNEKFRQNLSEYAINIGFNYISPNGEKINYENILPTFSTTHAFYLVMQTIIKEHDIVIFPSPTYGLFVYIPERLGATVKFIELKKENNFLIDPDLLDLMIKNINNELKIKFKDSLSYIPRVAAFVNINPHNPTGKVMNSKNYDLLKSINKVCFDNNVMIIDDLVYRDLTYSDDLALPLGTFKQYFPNCISLFGISKSFNLASLRAGFIVADKVVINSIRNKIFHTIDSMSIFQTQVLSNVFCNQKLSKYHKKVVRKYYFKYDLLKSLVDGIEVIKNKKRQNKIYKKIKKFSSNKENLKFVLKGLKNISFVQNSTPESGFFAILDFTNIKEKCYNKIRINNEKTLLKLLYEECGVKCIPGSAIGWNNVDELIMRVSYSLSDKDLITAFERINIFSRRIKNETNWNYNKDKQ